MLTENTGINNISFDETGIMAEMQNVVFKK